jgi:hypothetical protein
MADPVWGASDIERLTVENFILSAEVEWNDIFAVLNSDIESPGEPVAGVSEDRRLEILKLLRAKLPAAKG